MLVGNPIMHHLVLGIDPTPLGTAPFTLATDEPVDAWADDIELDLPNAHLHVLPCIAGHVGADTAAAVLQEGPHRGDARACCSSTSAPTRRSCSATATRLFAASSPTGPAFEGAQIVVRAARDRRRDRAGAHRSATTLEPRLKVIGVDAVVGRARVRRAVAPSASPASAARASIEAIAELFLAGVIRCATARSTAPAAGRAHPRRARRPHVRVRAARRADGELRITQNDVRAIQLAKAALHAGVDLLMDHAGDHRLRPRPPRRRVRQPHRPVRTRSCSA